MDQLWALTAVRRLADVRIYSPTREHRERFAERARDELRIEIGAVSSAHEAVAEADIVILATRAQTPVIDAGWIRSGAHVATLGPKTLAGHEGAAGTRRAAAARSRAAGADLRLPATDRLGAAARCRRDRLRPLDRVEGAQARWDLRRPRAVREPANSYEWPCPGDLLHMDVSKYARFLRPGHRVTGDRSQRLRGRSVDSRVGYDFAHAIVDDHSRLAYVELHDDEKAATVTSFVERALAFFAEHGIVCKRLMTDNGFSYVKNRSLAELLTRQGIRHLTTQPYRPRTNGKVERFHQTMAREWAYGLAYRSSRHRATALPHWLDHYNRQRPHSSIGDRPPISRVHNVRG